MLAFEAVLHFTSNGAEFLSIGKSWSLIRPSPESVQNMRRLSLAIIIYSISISLSIAYPMPAPGKGTPKGPPPPPDVPEDLRVKPNDKLEIGAHVEILRETLVSVFILVFA